MRKEFGRIICELAEKDEDIILIVGDIGYKIFDEFRERFPDRYINIGICEQSMMSAIAGMALEGFKPYVYSITPFLMERAFEQVKIDIDINRVNVKIIGYADYPEQGPTHSCANIKKMEDMFKYLGCWYPNNIYELRDILKTSYKTKVPTFISLRKSKNE